MSLEQPPSKTKIFRTLDNIREDGLVTVMQPVEIGRAEPVDPTDTLKDEAIRFYQKLPPSEFQKGGTFRISTSEGEFYIVLSPGENTYNPQDTWKLWKYYKFTRKDT